MKNLILIISVILSLGCGNATEEPKRSLESIAVNFFVDSLLHRQDFRQNNMEVVDSDIYDGGLFSNRNIFTEKYLSGVSEPYVNAITLSLNKELFSTSERERLKLLIENYNEKKEEFKKGEHMIEVPSPITEISFEDFEKKLANYKNAVFLNIFEHIETNGSHYVQLQFFDYTDSPMYEIYNLYIVLDDQGKVKGWFFN